jgi:enamine deaminase RidA (YjgF/YER057c/UK114 family)
MPEDRITRIPAPVIPGISDSTRVTAGDLVFVSGAVGFEDDGSVPTDFGRAVELTLREVERALKAHDATLADLVRINVYIEHLDKERLGTFRRVRDTIFDPEKLPASTVIGVYSLFNESTIEVDAIAAV